MPGTTFIFFSTVLFIWAAGPIGAWAHPQVLFKENVLNSMTIIPLA